VGQHISFSVNNGVAQHKEKLIHPLTYSGYNIGIGATFTKKTKKNNLYFINFWTNGIVTAKNRNTNDMSRLELSLTAGKLFPTPYTNWKTGFGLQARYDYSLYSLNYGYPFWFTQYTVNWMNQFDYEINEKINLSAKLSIPLAGMFSRTKQEVTYPLKKDYTKAYFHRDLSLNSFNAFKAILVNTTISKKFKKAQWGIGYQFIYYAYEQPVQLQSLANNITIRFSKKIKNHEK
jgi:hypothetical protein